MSQHGGGRWKCTRRRKQRGRGERRRRHPFIPKCLFPSIFCLPRKLGRCRGVLRGQRARLRMKEARIVRNEWGEEQTCGHSTGSFDRPDPLPLALPTTLAPSHLSLKRCPLYIRRILIVTIGTLLVQLRLRCVSCSHEFECSLDLR
jgi:hypothetical protein